MIRFPKQKYLSHAITAIAALTAAAGPMQAYAEKALDEVIVTAQKKDDTLQTVPMTVNAVTSETIAKYNLLDFKDIQTVTPGLTIKAQDARTSTVALRGLSVLTDSVASASVAIYWNEITYDIDSAFNAMYDVGQIEVLRGPQGTLRGVTSPSGAITIKTKEPNFNQIEGTVEQSLGERSLSNTQFGVSLPIIEDKLALRVAGIYDYNKTSGIENLVTGQENTSIDRSGRVTLGLRATENLEAQLVYQYLESNTSGLNPMVGCGTAGNVSQCLDASDRKSVAAENSDTFHRREITGLRVEWDMGPATLTSVTGYQNQKNDTTLAVDPGNALPSSLIAGTKLSQPGISEIHIFSQELRLASNDADFYNWLYGLYGTNIMSNTAVKSSGVLRLFFDPNTFMDLVSISPVVIPQGAENFGIFTNQSFQWTDKLESQVGVRYQKLRSHQQLTTPTFALGPFHVDDEGVTGTASISYQLTDDVRLYTSYGRSFRGGGFTIAPNSPHDLTQVDPETSNSIEVGFKSRFADGRVQINGDIYYQTYKNFLARTSQAVRTVDLANNNTVATNFLDYNAEAQVSGAELQVDALLTDDWQAGLGLSYTDAKLTGGEAPCNVYVGGILQTPVGSEVNRCTAHGRLSGEPNWSLSTTSEYTMHFGAVDGFVRGLYTFNSGRSDDSLAGSVLDTSGYGVFNLFVGARDPKKTWELSVWAKNLFDHQQVIRRSPEATFAYTNIPLGPFAPNPALVQPLASGYSEVQVIPERQIGITGKYNFSL